MHHPERVTAHCLAARPNRRIVRIADRKLSSPAQSTFRKTAPVGRFYVALTGSGWVANMGAGLRQLGCASDAE
jgi:hypothetical protein